MKLSIIVPDVFFAEHSVVAIFVEQKSQQDG
jgi:hypothetical protein